MHYLHGDAIWKFFTPESKSEAESQGWNTKTNRPITSEELELEDAIDCAESYAWVKKESPKSNKDDTEGDNLERPEKEAETGPEKETTGAPGVPVQAAAPGEVIPGEVAFQPLDNQSFSTFGGGGAASVANSRPLAARNPVPQDMDDSASIVSRVSVVEEDIKGMKEDVAAILQLLQVRNSTTINNTDNSDALMADDSKQGSEANNS
jgi:hypothetical protein